MHTNIPFVYRLRSLRGIVALSVLFLYIAGIALGTTAVHASGTPGGNVSDPVVRAVDIAKPAVVRIFTLLNSHLTVHFSATQSVTFPQNSAGYPLTLSGSGTFISAHGDILTADHVINPPHDQQLSQFLDAQAAPDVANYINQNLKPSSPVTADVVSQELTSGQLPSDQSYDMPKSEVFLSTDYTGPQTASDLNSVPANLRAPVDRIEQESAVNQADVAIIHVNMNDMPSVQLGDSSSVQQQDLLTIIGFPGNGDVSNTATNILTSSVNQIFVSSIKTTDQGDQVIQVAGNVEHGDSGGPALDKGGNVVGIVSFGLSDQGNTSFLQASNSARKLVQNLHLDTAPGQFERAWEQAFNDYAATTPGHWHKAAQEFSRLASNYPLFKAITPYLTYAQAQAKNEPLSPSGQSTPPPMSSQVGQPGGTSIPSLLWIIVAGVAVLVLAVLTTFALVWRRSTRAQLRVNAATMRAAESPLPNTIVQQGQNRPPSPSQVRQGPQQLDGMAAFGAPPPSSPAATLRPGQQPVRPSATFPGSSAASGNISGTLRPWPCGHMNRPNARYCSICGEPAPPPPARRVEQ